MEKRPQVSTPPQFQAYIRCKYHCIAEIVKETLWIVWFDRKIQFSPRIMLSEPQTAIFAQIGSCNWPSNEEPFTTAICLGEVMLSQA